jgi:hypothetical protein
MTSMHISKCSPTLKKNLLQLVGFRERYSAPDVGLFQKCWHLLEEDIKLHQLYLFLSWTLFSHSENDHQLHSETFDRPRSQLFEVRAICEFKLMHERIDAWTNWCMNELMHEQTDAWTNWCMNELMHERIDAWTNWRMNELMHERTDAWTNWCMNELMHERTDAWTNWCMNELMHERTDAWTNWCMNELMHERTDAWTNWCMNELMHERIDAWTNWCMNELLSCRKRVELAFESDLKFALTSMLRSVIVLRQTRVVQWTTLCLQDLPFLNRDNTVVGRV